MVLQFFKIWYVLVLFSSKPVPYEKGLLKILTSIAYDHRFLAKALQRQL